MTFILFGNFKTSIQNVYQVYNQWFTTMKIDSDGIEELSKLQENIIQREKEERTAAAILTSETLSQLNISIDALPQRCQQLLLTCSSLQAAMNVEELDPIALSLRQSRLTRDLMEEEFELLELRQKNVELQRQVERNNKNIEGLIRELQSSKESLANQNPGPENIQEHIRQLKQKLASYEDIYEKAKAKFSKLHIPEDIMPKSIEELALRLASLKEEEESLRLRAEDITLARQARNTLNKLRRV